jgi:hypothetical protein
MAAQAMTGIVEPIGTIRQINLLALNANGVACSVRGRRLCDRYSNIEHAPVTAALRHPHLSCDVRMRLFAEELANRRR